MRGASDGRESRGTGDGGGSRGTGEVEDKADEAEARVRRARETRLTRGRYESERRVVVLILMGIIGILLLLLT